MPAVTEVARLRRDVETLSDLIRLDLRPGAKQPMSPKDRRAIKSELEWCIQQLDELRTKLTAG